MSGLSDSDKPDEMDTGDVGNMPWSSFNEYFSFEKEKDVKNFLSLPSTAWDYRVHTLLTQICKKVSNCIMFIHKYQFVPL